MKVFLESFSFDYFFGLCDQTIGFLIILWPGTINFSGGVIITGWYTVKKPFNKKLLFVLLLFAFPILMLVWGTLFRSQESGPYLSSHPQWIDWIGEAISLGSLICGSVLTLIMKPYRWFVFAFSALIVWLTMVATFVAGMSVSGEGL
jgi:hypothetical protein